MFVEIERWCRTCGLTELNRSNYFGLYTRLLSRINRLYRIYESYCASFGIHVVTIDRLRDLALKNISAYDDVLRSDEFICCSDVDKFHVLKAEIAFLALCFSRLDINNTIDSDIKTLEKFDFYKYGTVSVVTAFNKYYTEYSFKSRCEYYNHVVLPGRKDEVTEMLVNMTYNKRKSMYTQRLINEILCLHDDGWFFVFDTLTLDDVRLDNFYANKTAMRDYFRKIGNEVLKAENRSVNDSYNDCYKYFCVPEFGTDNGRLHFHVLHCIRTLPFQCKDPNYGKKTRNYREIRFFKQFWNYGFSSPIAVRYTNDAFTKKGWLWVVDKNKQPLKAKPPVAVALYICKYVSKQINQTQSIKRGEEKWAIQTMMKKIETHNFRIRMSRGFGMRIPKNQNMDNLTMDDLCQLTQVNSQVVKFPQIIKHLSKKELRKRLNRLSVEQVLSMDLATINLLKSIRESINSQESSLAVLAQLMFSSLKAIKKTDLSSRVIDFLTKADLLRNENERQNSFSCSSK